MGGTEADSKRKRKRKTRSERNLLASHLLSLEGTQERDKNTVETAEKSHNTSYCLRSGKAVSCPVEMRKANRNGVSITRGRLTRRVGLFASIQSSDWISRDPNTEKREDDKKRGKKTQRNSFDVALQRMSNIQDIDHTGDSSLTLSKTTHDADADEQDIMLIDVPSFHSGNLSASNDPKQKRKQSSSGSATGEIASNTSDKSSDLKEFLDPVLPYQEISEKISKDLRLKITRIFPSRHLEMEICSNLQKLLRQSSQRISGTDTYEDVSKKNLKCFEGSCKEVESPAMEALLHSSSSSPKSIFLPASTNAIPSVTSEGDPLVAPPFHHTCFHPTVPQISQDPCNLPQQTSVDLGCHLYSGIPTCDSGGFVFNEGSRFEKSNKPEVLQRTMDICIQKDEESDEEKTSGLLLAQYHAFILSSRKLKALQKLQQQSAMETEMPHRSSIESLSWKCNYPHCTCKSGQQHHQHSHHQHHHHHSHHDSTNSGQGGLAKSSTFPFTSHPMTSSFISKQMVKELDDHSFSHLDVSRHRLKTALESASSEYHNRSSLCFLQNNAGLNVTRPSGMSPEPSLFSTCHEKALTHNRGLPCASSSLGQMKIHQKDLQYQARDFLDELDHEHKHGQSHTCSSNDSLTHSFLSDSVLQCGRLDMPSFPWKGPLSQ